MLRSCLWILLLLGIGLGLTIWKAGPRLTFWMRSDHWTQTAPGMDVARLTGAHGERVMAVRMNPARCTFRVHDAYTGVTPPGAWAESICPAHGAVINASYFGDAREPLGLLVVDGQLRQRHFPRHEWGTFQVRDGKAELVLSSNTLAPDVTQAIECKPRLITQGIIPSFKPQRAASRSAVGIDKQGRVIFAVTDGSDLTLEQWASFLRDRLGCMEALNLDGGPSAQLTVHGRVPINVKGGWPVPTLLVGESK
jgi:uncharacterized protein YigE (DUF2233 family)